MNFTPDYVRQNNKVPKELQGAYSKIIKAGVELMLNEKTRPATLKYLSGEGPAAQKLGEGTAGLMLYLFQRSNKTMPPQLIIPAGVELLAEGADMMRKAGAEVSDADIAEAVVVMIETMAPKFGVEPGQLIQGAAK